MKSLILSLVLFATPSLALAGEAGVAIVAGDASVVAVDAAPAAPDAAAPAAPVVPAAPEDLGEALATITAMVDLARAGQWMLVAILLLQLLIFGVKRWAPEAFMKSYGSATAIGLAGVIALLSSLLGGLPWMEAVFIFISGPVSSVGYDLLKQFGVIKKADA